MIIGYTAGVYDLFHIGHLNIFYAAKQMCDKLIVGVSTDELVASIKDKKCIIPFNERIEIVKNIKYVDLAVPQKSRNKLDAYSKLKYNKLFVGDDWYGTDTWIDYSNKLAALGVEVIYFPYTDFTSTTKILTKIKGESDLNE
jgi:glycerol-3-phosphate cytidylyltransferase